jgi:hypothetical protein
MNFTCPVCLYQELPYPPQDYHICPCCGTEFGNDDAFKTPYQLRTEWIASGAKWFFGNPPRLWNPFMQLIDGGHAEDVPQFISSISSSVNITFTPTKNITPSPWLAQVA